MKKLIFTLSLIMFVTGAFAQSKAIMGFHERFKDNGKYLAVKIDGGLLEFLANIQTGDEEAEEVLKALRKLDAINIHAIDRDSEDLDENYIKDFMGSIRKENFEELMKVREGDTKVDFLIKEKNGKVSDLLMIVDEEKEFVILSFSGEIDLVALARLSGELDIKGARHLEKMDNQ